MSMVPISMIFTDGTDTLICLMNLLKEVFISVGVSHGSALETPVWPMSRPAVG